MSETIRSQKLTEVNRTQFGMKMVTSRMVLKKLEKEQGPAPARLNMHWQTEAVEFKAKWGSLHNSAKN